MQTFPDSLHFDFSVSQIVPFYKLRVCGHPALSKSVGAIFPAASAHFVFLCDILVILTMFQIFSL